MNFDLLLLKAANAITLENPLGEKGGDDFFSLLKVIGDWLVLIGAPIAIFMILIGAFHILTSAGEPEKIKRGKSTILWTVVGYAILLLGTEITSLISDFFSK